MSEVFGFHDAFGSGAFHTILGGFTLGVLGKVGSRKIKFNSFSRARDIPANSEISVIFGNILLIFGLFGLYLYSINPFSEIKNEFGSFVSTVNVYGNPISFYGILLNFIMGISGGLVISLVLSFNDNKKIFIGGIVGIVSISAGADYYHPIHCLLISMAVSLAVFKSFNYIEERFKIDDASDIVVSHGFAGFWGLVIASILLWGYPSSIVENSVFTNPFGQFAGALIIFWLLGFIPGYLTASVLKFFKILHLSDTVKIIGQDILSTRDKIIETNNIYEAEKKIISEMKSNKK
jgi:ammonia channel protein AmtB